MIKRSHHAPIRGGFTLMEMMVVVAIIVVLVAIAVPLYMGRLEEAKRQAAQANIRNLSQAADLFRLKNDRYPANLAELTLPTPDGGLPFVEHKALIDPWQRPYEYLYPGQRNGMYGKPDIWSQGPHPGDANSFVGNW